MSDVLDGLAGEAAALVLRAAGAPPGLADAVARMAPRVLAFARSRLAAGRDPVAELDALMSGAEEAYRQAFMTRFGEDP